jgi:hypothetical protein
MTTHHRIIPAALAALAIGANATPASAMLYGLDGGGSSAPAHTTASTSAPTSATAGGDFLAPAAPPPTASVPAVATPQAGFDWGDAGIGAAAGFALALVGLGATLVITQHRTRRPTTSPGAIS